MASEREIFWLSGPLHLTAVNWTNPHHQRSVAASLVKGVYILERDRQQKRDGPQALAPPWWDSFHFQLFDFLIDNADSSIFGAIYELKSQASSYNNSAYYAPKFVIAFRGTILKPDSMLRDLELDLQVIRNKLHKTSRFQIAMQAVQNMVTVAGVANIWLVGHSLGSAIAMLAGKQMAKMNYHVKSYLFNPPFVSAPIERIKNRKLKHGMRIMKSITTAGITVAVKGGDQRPQDDPFVALSAWIPYLFVNPGDYVCSEYIGYFENRKKMKEIGADKIERLATKNSIRSLLVTALGKEYSEPFHLLPSAYLTINQSASLDFEQAHGLHQWWRPDFHCQSELYRFM